MRARVRVCVCVCGVRVKKIILHVVRTIVENNKRLKFLNGLGLGPTPYARMTKYTYDIYLWRDNFGIYDFITTFCFCFFFFILFSFYI